MAKYPPEFKLNVVQFYLSGQGGQKKTAHVLGITHSDVRKWVDMYQRHGEAGLIRKIHYQKRSLDFKLRVISAVLNDGLSQREASVEFNLNEHSSISR